MCWMRMEKAHDWARSCPLGEWCLENKEFSSGPRCVWWRQEVMWVQRGNGASSLTYGTGIYASDIFPLTMKQESWTDSLDILPSSKSWWWDGRRNMVCAVAKWADSVIKRSWHSSWRITGTRILNSFISEQGCVKATQPREKSFRLGGGGSIVSWYPLNNLVFKILPVTVQLDKQGQPHFTIRWDNLESGYLSQSKQPACGGLSKTGCLLPYTASAHNLHAVMVCK